MANSEALTTVTSKQSQTKLYMKARTTLKLSGLTRERWKQGRNKDK